MTALPAMVQGECSSDPMEVFLNIRVVMLVARHPLKNTRRLNRGNREQTEMNKHIKYLIYIVRHIYFVSYACYRKGILGRGLTHDLSKFRPDEWIPYANYFYGKKRVEPVRDSTGYYKAAETGDQAFDFAWLLHQKRNRHHWQWWVLPLDDGGIKVLPMDSISRLEMLCDWWGASMAQGYKGKSKSWYETNKGKMQLHPDTRAWVETNVSDNWI
jgi:hypothetical protein